MNKDDWMRRVGRLLGFHGMPADVAAHAEHLYDQKASTTFAAEWLREFLSGSPDSRSDK